LSPQEKKELIGRLKKIFENEKGYDSGDDVQMIDGSQQVS